MDDKFIDMMNAMMKHKHGSSEFKKAKKEIEQYMSKNYKKKQESQLNLFHEAKQVLDKDGKVNALGPYGRQKLTGREMSTYFRRNKVKDAQVKKAVEVALDLSGAMDIARKEIKKFYGDKVLKSKEVQQALQYANEEVFKEDLNKNDAVLEENYRVLAKKGMGAETKNSIKVGTEVDYYRADGAKYMGKIIKMGPKSYIVKDMKNGKNYQFMYHDRVQAKKYLKQGDNIVEADAEKKAELALKQTREKEQLAKKHEREKESIADSYRRMWENGEKYAPSIEENIERKIMSKMRKSKAPKGLPR